MTNIEDIGEMARAAVDASPIRRGMVGFATGYRLRGDWPDTAAIPGRLPEMPRFLRHCLTSASWLSEGSVCPVYLTLPVMNKANCRCFPSSGLNRTAQADRPVLPNANLETPPAA